MPTRLHLNPLGKTLKNAARLRTIVGVFAKHGFHQLAEKAGLGKFLVPSLSARVDVDKYSTPERVRMSFEELGPTFVKLGQLLATRPDLVPPAYITEFEKLHDRVQPLPFAQIEDILSKEFGERRHAIFESVSPEPLGSASIAQVHRARLVGGDSVVIKVQRPGIVETINNDLDVLYMLADLLQKYVPETRLYDPPMVVNEFFKTLEMETNFIVEANNIRRFAENFAKGENPSPEQVKIPKVYLELTTEKILVMESAPGIPLSHDEALKQPDVDPQEIVRIGLRAYLKMVFIDGLFHGDLHAGNFFVIPGNRIALIDFGVVGRLNPKTRASIINMLVALSKEDYERLALEYVDLAPFTDQVNVDLFARELRELIAPFYGLTLKNVNLGNILMGSASIASRHRLKVPTELMTFFKSIVAIEGLGRRIDKNFDFLQVALEFATEIVKHQMDPQRLLGEMTQTPRESRNLIQNLPRQLSFYIRKVNAPDYAARVDLRGLEDVKRAVEISFNLLFLGVIISALILSATLLFAFPGHLRTWLGVPLPSLIMYLMSGLLGVLGFFNYIRKA